MRHMNSIRALVYAGLIAFAAAQTACAPASGSEAAADPDAAVLGEYGPKDWRSGATALACTRSGGTWSCVPNGGVSQSGCAGLGYGPGSVFKIQPGGWVYNSFGTEPYVRTGNTFSWLSTGYTVQIEPYGADYIMSLNDNCAMVYDRRSL